MSEEGALPPGSRSLPHVLREYALLADGERGVLVGPRGDFGWMCFPRWHDDAVFCSLLGGESGYAITPRGRFVWGGYYEPGGLIWRSRWVTEQGIVESREALAMPADPELAIVLRRVVAVDGPARVDVVLSAGAGFDRHGMAALKQEGDAWSASLGEAGMLWLGGADASPRQGPTRGKALYLQLDLEPGQHHDFVLALARQGSPQAPPPAAQLWRATEESWRRRVPELNRGLGSRDARHAYAVMAGLTAGNGGMVAAATTSLPERAEQGRNYDYRYVWIRDQAYAGLAVAAAGPHGLLDDAVGFVGARLLADGSQLCPAYTVDGERVPAERQLSLPGYPGGHDTAGNWVREQFQLDAFGEALLLFAAAAGHDRLDADGWRAAEVAIEAIRSRGKEADAGIWELEPGRWAHSRLCCAAGLRAIAAHAPGPRRPASWSALADALVADASAACLHPSGRVPLTIRESTRRCCWPRSAAPSPPRIHAPRPPSTRSRRS
jgi:alpha,alpha-trehalase